MVPLQIEVKHRQQFVQSEPLVLPSLFCVRVLSVPLHLNLSLHWEHWYGSCLVWILMLHQLVLPAEAQAAVLTAKGPLS